MSFTLYTIKTRSNIPVLLNGVNLFSVDLVDLLVYMMDQQYDQSVTNVNRYFTHPAFKLTDIALFNKYFKIARARTYKLMPGDTKNLKKFKNKPQTINTAGLMDTGEGSSTYDNVNYVALKGERHYMWRVHSMNVENEGDSERSMITPAFNFTAQYHYRYAWIANDQYNMQISAIPPTGSLNYRVIYPGTSTKGALAPAI